MSLTFGREPSGLEWAAAARALGGGPISGDQHLCAPTRDGLLAAVVDGLGHGAEAAHAAGIAVETLAGDPEAAVDELIRRCHVALRSTRGVVMTLASLRAGEVTWAGVGNVECVLIRAGTGRAKVAAGITSRGGVVGYQLPAIRPARQPLEAADLLILATDGIDREFVRTIVPTQRPDEIAASILETHGRENDDALVLVVRAPGGVAR